MTVRTCRHIALACLLVCWQLPVHAEITFNSELVDFQTEVVADKLVHPWSMAFLPDGDILVTERGGQLLRLAADGSKRDVVSQLPPIEEFGQGGLLDVILDPGYTDNNIIYLSYAANDRGKYGTEVLRARLDKTVLRNQKVIFRLSKKTTKPYHFGSRLLFADDGTLFITLGDRGERPRAQDRMDHAGSLIRILPDGGIPADNPFHSGDALPGVYTWGNRNMQGIAIHPQTRAIYTHEHGPQGGDELNRMLPGVNYGWPVITYGVNYVSGTAIGKGTSKAGMQQPLHHWVPSIAPSGMVFYTGDEFPEWQGHLFIGSLKFGQLVRLELKDDRVVHEERLLNNRLGRIRDVRQGPGGGLYLLTDERNGLLLRLVRAN